MIHLQIVAQNNVRGRQGVLYVCLTQAKDEHKALDAEQKRSLL